jgi:hypothetical protein
MDSTAASFGNSTITVEPWLKRAAPREVQAPWCRRAATRRDMAAMAA